MLATLWRLFQEPLAEQAHGEEDAIAVTPRDRGMRESLSAFPDEHLHSGPVAEEIV